MYNQDNREQVLRDEQAYDEVQKAKRAKFEKAESEYRHACLLARARKEPLVSRRCSSQAMHASAWGR